MQVFETHKSGYYSFFKAFLAFYFETKDINRKQNQQRSYFKKFMEKWKS